MRNEDDEIQILGSAETPLKDPSGLDCRMDGCIHPRLCMSFLFPAFTAGVCCRPTAA